MWVVIRLENIMLCIWGLFSENERHHDLRKQRVRAKHRHLRVLSVRRGGVGALNRFFSYIFNLIYKKDSRDLFF